MKNANERMPASRMLRNAVWIFFALEPLDHVLADLVGLGLDAERQHPAAGCFRRRTNAGSVRLSARALPNHWIGRLRAMSSSQNALNDFTLSVTVSPQR